MNLTKSTENSYIPSYTRTDLTDDLHEKNGIQNRQ